MRMKTIQALRTVARWTRRILDVQMAMGEIYGLRTRRRTVVKNRGSRSGV